ncbi:unnamed protein product [Spirodela intermedia]|uniref:Uncharacterized protein n=1 Tax=Spirodela intermedia TaxID=51605 RepID=A0A7I8JA74_SPIIN|nr:unnamed protein product [Spirodela intermedia]CAA6666675.1 unnamed protein product [Spirodela intermedia]
MEAAAGRGGSLPVPSSSQRKEWRAVPEHCFRSNGSGGSEHGKLGQSDERTIYEVQEETGQLEVDFCSITIDGSGTNDDILQRRLHSISRQREELEQIEIDLRAQIVARSEIMEVQKNFDAQIKEHANAAAKLKEQLHEREQIICALEIKVEEKDRELRAVKIDNEAVWAKEDLLREQNKELANFRIERDSLEAERAQHMKQIHDLQECIQEKDHRYLELEEQHRVAQETILFKDEQLREAQAWMFAEVDRHHRQAIQQLQLELAEAKEQSGIQNDDSRFGHTGSKDSSSYLQNNGNQFANDGSSACTANGDGVSLLSSPSASTKSQQVPGVPGVPVVPSSILGMGAFIPSGPVIAPHPFVVHPQGAPQSVASASSHLSQNQMGPVPALSHQHWQSQQAVQDAHRPHSQPPSQVEQDLLKSDGQYSYEISSERQVVHSDILETLKSPRQGSESMACGSNEKGRALDGEGPQETTHKSSSFHAALVSDTPESSSEHKINVEKTVSSANGVEAQVVASEDTSGSGAVLNGGERSVNFISVSECNINAVLVQEAIHTESTSGKVPEPNLLDERALLACLVRAIPPESALFVIKGDFIHLREGAKEIISASTAVAKVAAAAASFAPYSSVLPSVAVTPVAQTHRQRKDSTAELKAGRSIPNPDPSGLVYPGDFSRAPSQISTGHGQRQNGVNLDIFLAFLSHESAASMDARKMSDKSPSRPPFPALSYLLRAQPRAAAALRCLLQPDDKIHKNPADSLTYPFVLVQRNTRVLKHGDQTVDVYSHASVLRGQR